MFTMGDALNLLGETLFVGRGRELAIFTEWLGHDSLPPEILNVSGHGGVGKSTLLRSFARSAREAGWGVLSVDCSDLPHTPDGLFDALVAPNLDGARPVVLLDTFEALGELQRFLVEQLLPRLPVGAKVVIAGRHPLSYLWAEDAPWRRVVRPLPLGGFQAGESREYLHRRGVLDEETVERVLVAAGGNPLALSLAADMVLQLGIRDLTRAPRWHLVVRSLVERLLRDAQDPGLQAMLEAAAVVRQFDEATLAAISGQKAGPAFGRLCRLSAIRPAQHGLMLHDDLRRAVADDLRWRHLDRYRELRLRALAYYRERMRVAPPAEREWLVAERLFLWENGLIQTMLFNEGEPGELWIEKARPEDHPEIRRVHTWWMRNVMDKDVDPDRIMPEHDLFLDAILAYPGTRLRVARGLKGRVLGFSSALPVCRETLPILDAHPVLAPLLHRYWGPSELEKLPATPVESEIWYPVHMAEGEMMSEQVRAALLRDHMGLYMRGGLYLLSVRHPAAKELADAWGFHLIPEARSWSWGPNQPVDGYVLDLRQIGVERWIEAIMAGKRPVRGLRRDELERELHEVLLHWRDGATLARSPLADLLLAPQAESEAERAEGLRRTIQAAIETARKGATAQQEIAYRALELAYLQRIPSHDAAAERLAVSRATFYRLLKRGIGWLAGELSRY